LEDQFQQSQAEYIENKNKIQKMIPSKEEEHQKDVMRRHVIHMLANEKVLLNNTIGKNRNYKHEIDIARKEIR